MVFIDHRFLIMLYLVYGTCEFWHRDQELSTHLSQPDPIGSLGVEEHMQHALHDAVVRSPFVITYF